MVDYNAARYRAYVVAERQSYLRAVAYQRAQAQLAYDRAHTQLHQAPVQFNAYACGRFGRCIGQPRQLQGSVPKPLKIVGLGLGAVFLTGIDFLQAGADVADISALTGELSGDDSAFAAASNSASKAADDPASIFVKDKHLNFFNGKYAQFATGDKAEAQSWIAEALRNPAGVFKTNPLPDTFKLEVPMGRAIGTKG